MNGLSTELGVSIALARGFAVLPIYGIGLLNNENAVCMCGMLSPGCHTPGKHPITRHGVMDATKNPHIIKQWIKKYPNCNWAVATGGISNITVLDVDFGSGGKESLTYFSSDIYHSILNTFKVKTGNGFHAYFLYQEGVKNKVGLYSGVDVRNDGGYVLIPNSVHYTLKKYTWINKAEILAMPDELKELMLTKSQTISDEYADCEAMIPEGRRNAALFYFGTSMRSRGLSMRAISAALKEENQMKCSPPLQDWELNTILESISKYEAGDGLGLWY